MIKKEPDSPFPPPAVQDQPVVAAPVDDAPEPDPLADVVAATATEQQDPEPVVEDDKEPEVKEAPEDTTGFFNLLSSEFGDESIEELELDGFYKDLKPTHIKDLPVPAKHIIHNLRRAHIIEKKNHEAQIVAKDKTIAQREQALAAREREFLKRQQEFAAAVNDPRVLEAVKIPEGDLPDPYTPEGIDARVKRGVAESMQGFLAPFQQAASDRQRESTWADFVAQNPEMKDKGFQREVLAIIQDRKKSGIQITTQDAYRINKLQRLENEARNRRATETAARSESARRVARTTSTGNPGKSTEIPPEVKRDPVKLMAWLKANPEQQRQIDAAR